MIAPANRRIGDLGHARLIVALTLGLIVLSIPIGCGTGPESMPSEEVHEHEGIAVTLWTDKSELFFEYPPMVAGAENGSWAIHLTRMSDFSPITEGTLTLEFRASDGSNYTITADAPARPGIYTPAPQPPKPGIYEVTALAAGPQLEDRIPVGPIEVYADESAIPHDETADAGGISFLKEQQWPIDFAVERAAMREIPVSIEVTGLVVPAAGRVAEVAAPVSGLAEAQPNLSAPAPGDRVAKGQALLVLSPTSQDDSFARLKADAARLRREVERLTRLFEAEAVPEKRLIEARSELDVAEAAVDAIDPTGDGGFDLSLRAPISGMVQERHFTPGQRVEVGETLYRIVDPRVVWIQLNVPAVNAGEASGAGMASFSVEGNDRRYRAGRLVSVGAVIDPQTRTLPVIVAADNGDGSLKIGQFATALLAVGGKRQGIAIPNAAIQREDGQSVAYVQVGGESFARRVLTLGPSDGTHTLVESGIAQGDFVVTLGAYQVYLASLSTSDIAAEGHAH